MKVLLAFATFIENNVTQQNLNQFVILHEDIIFCACLHNACVSTSVVAK